MSNRHQEIAQALFPQLARIGRAVGSPARLQLLHLLMQAPRTVEVLADMTGISMANTSQHLQHLKRACLVETSKQGQHVEYRLASQDVARLCILLTTVASRQLAELDRVQRTLVQAEPVDLPATLREVRAGTVTLLDVRPLEEFAAGHVEGALSIPLADLPTRVGELSKQREVVAYCRGAFCVMASEAVALLRARGIKARAVDLNVVELMDRGMRIRRPVPAAAASTPPAARRARRNATPSPKPASNAPAAKRRKP